MQNELTLAIDREDDRMADTDIPETTGGGSPLADARLWAGLSGPQQEAAQEIARAFEALSQGLGFTTVDWERIPGAAGANNPLELRERQLAAYTAWARACKARGLSHSLVIDILVFGFSCRQLDADAGERPGHASRNLHAALSLYAVMRGWNP